MTICMSRKLQADCCKINYTFFFKTRHKTRFKNDVTERESISKLSRTFRRQNDFQNTSPQVDRIAARSKCPRRALRIVRVRYGKARTVCVPDGESRTVFRESSPATSDPPTFTSILFRPIFIATVFAYPLFFIAGNVILKLISCSSTCVNACAENMYYILHT